MSVAIVSDSTCDLCIDGKNPFGVDVVPLLVTIGEKVYRDGIDMTNEQFFHWLSKASILPTTSQPPPATFQELFRRRLDEGREIVGIFVSTGLSGTYQSAMIARSSFSNEEQKKIYLVDSLHATISLGVLVRQACVMRDRGAGAADIAAAITELVPRTKLFALFDTLKYLKMGGRLTGVEAFAGTLLNIAPVCGIINGKLVPVAKIRKRQSVFQQWLREKLLSELPDPQYPAAVAHSNNPPLSTALYEEFRYLLPLDKTLRLALGCVVGTHTGPSAQGVAYIAKAK